MHANFPESRECNSPVLALWVAPWLQDDGIFDPTHPNNRDDVFYGIRALRDKLKARGWAVHTQDVLQSASAPPDAVLFLEVPRRPIKSLLMSWAQHTRSYALLIESPLVRPHEWEVRRHKQFDGLFTWHTKLSKEAPYIVTPLGSIMGRDISLMRDISAKRKLCVMIAGNKKSRVASSKDLYKKRLDIIRWYEANRPRDFDLYGTGWNDATIRYSWRLRRLGLMGLVNKLVGTESRPSYRGPVKDKIPVLEQYRFNIAFENVRDIPGYITEKIFDSFLGSCVPVYLGAPDVAEFIPRDCFIDFRDCMTIEALDARLREIGDDEYLSYISRIEEFLRSSAADTFRADYWAETIVQHIAG